MKIKHVVETDKGELVFQGNISGPELAFIVEVGINTLAQNGALPFLTDKENMENLIFPETDYEQ